MTPRRSSRARTTQPPPGPPTHTNSSTSSTSLTRAERNTRATNRPFSPPLSSTHRSESPGGIDATPLAELAQPRRSRRGTETEEKAQLKQPDDDEDMDGVEEEVTRCICGQPDYPGPPHTIGDRSQHEDTASDDVGNFFIQCDHCHVWQHGGCMGLTDESMTPDEYYCEQCKPEFHKVAQAPDGSQSSRYLPVLEAPSSRSSSLSTQQSKRRDGKRNQSDASSSKRRATMNSRGAYDEDEMLRRAIEESKETGTLGKRPRDESEDHTHMTKRQRTSSSAESAAKRSRSPSQTSPDQDKSAANGTQETKRQGATTRTNKENELRDKQKELTALQRAEAANKRKARSERRRGEDSPPPTPSLSPAKAAGNNHASIKAKDNGDTLPQPRSNINNLRKKPAAKKGRLGRNQYTRDLPLNGGDTSDTPGADPRDPNDNNSPNGIAPNGQTGVVNGESGKSSKAKIHGKATSLNEMRRRVAGILEFVGSLQQLHGSAPGSGSGNSSGNQRSVAGTPNHTPQLPVASLVRAVERGLKEKGKDPTSRVNSDGNNDVDMSEEKAFNEMGSAEMLEMLTRQCVLWQGAYGKYGQKE